MTSCSNNSESPNGFPVFNLPYDKNLWIFLSTVWPAFYWSNHLANHSSAIKSLSCNSVNSSQPITSDPCSLREESCCCLCYRLGTPLALSWRPKQLLEREKLPLFELMLELLSLLVKAPTRVLPLFLQSPAWSVHHWTVCFSSNKQLLFAVKAISPHFAITLLAPFSSSLKSFTIQYVINFRKSPISALPVSQSF